ncbi:13719_t:CDS:1 [Gigaspora rosea]|nr:13719_t:CDS:1 [Gigaspora rosea]
MVNAQEYIDNNFSKDSRVINVAKKDLVGSLDLREYSNLEVLIIEINQITNLSFSEKNKNITIIEAYDNQLTNLNFLISLPNPEKLKSLGVFQNQITSNDLEILAPFVNCEMLSIGKNNIRGNLSSLRYWTNLKRLDLLGIKPQVWGLEYLAHNPFCGEFFQDYSPKNIQEFDNNTWRGSSDFRRLSNDKVCGIINDLWRQVQSQSQELDKLKNERSQEKKEQSQELDNLKKEQIQELDKLKEQSQELDKLKKDQNQELDKLKQQCQELDKLKKEQSQEFDKLKQQYQELDKLKKEQSQELDKLKKEQSQELDKLKQQLQEFSNLFFPNQSYDFTLLKQEITRLKYQELASQVRENKEQLNQLINNAKTKTGNLGNIVDLLLETQKEISKTKPESNDNVKGQLTAFQKVLENNLTKEELQNLLNEQTELFQLEEHLASLQINEVINPQ